MIARYIVMGLLTLATCVGVQAQTTLEDMVNQGDAAWMLGKWEGPSEDGTSVTLTFSWDLNKHVVVMHGKVGDEMEFKGFSAIEPGSGEVKYTGFDNRGTVTRGAWGMESGELTLRLESKTAEGSRKAAQKTQRISSQPNTGASYPHPHACRRDSGARRSRRAADHVKQPELGSSRILVARRDGRALPPARLI